VNLRPRGEEILCPGTNHPIFVTCNLTWTSTNILRWNVDSNGLNEETVSYVKGQTNISGILNNIGEIRVISKTSSYVVTRLEVPNSQGLIPMTVTCGDGAHYSESKQQYILRYKGKK